MDRSDRYSLGLYEKAMPMGLTFEQMLKTTKRCGFDRLEISIDESDTRLARLEWKEKKILELHRLTREFDVPILTMCLSGHRKYPFGSHNAATRERAMDIMKKAVDFSAVVGVRIIQLAGYDVYYEHGDDLTRRYFDVSLQTAVEYAASNGVMLAFETMETPFMDTAEKAMTYVECINSPWLGVYPDIGNLQNAAVRYGRPAVDDLKYAAGRIVAMHLKETRPGIYRNLWFGQGHTPYMSCLAFAAEQGIRLFTGEFWHREGMDYSRAILDSGIFLRAHLDTAFSQPNDVCHA